MAWNPSPEVSVSRDAAKKLNADMCVVLYVNTSAGSIGYASYGATRELCRETKRLADACYAEAMRWFEKNR